MSSEKQSEINDKTNDDLCVFGYQCKMFDRPNDGEHNYLIEHNCCVSDTEQKTVLMDRYDIRHHLWNIDIDRSPLLESAKINGGFEELPLHEPKNESESGRGEEDKVDDISEEPYVELEHYRIPPDMLKPLTKRQHSLGRLLRNSECTARYVIEHGVRMEILVKTKQANNDQFDFLKFDNSLYPYYQHIIHALKEGWIVVEKSAKVEQVVESDSDESESGEVYLHPCLTHHSHQPKHPPTTDSSYSRLVKSVEEINQRNSVAQPEPKPPIPKEIIPPPPDVLQVLDKMADYMAKNGDSLEQLASIKSDDALFGFLNPHDIYHPYYIMRKRLAEEEAKNDKSLDEVKKAVKFTINPPKKRSYESNTIAMFEDQDDDEEESLIIERLRKQKERRNKAKLFVEKLKKRKKKDE